MYTVQIDIATPDGLDTEQASAPMLLPHEVFAHLHSDPRSARLRLGFDVTQFWEQFARSPDSENHFVASDPAKWPHFFPIGFHGDSAKFTKQDSLMCLSWNGILAAGRDPLDTRQLIFALPTTWLLPGTLWQMAAVVAWSFAVLLDGTWPLEDHLGNPWPVGSARAARAGSSLANGMGACLVDFRGDWQFQAAFWNLPAWNGLQMCWLCKASKYGQLAWDLFGPDAAWRSAPRTTASYFQERPNVNPMCLLPGWSLTHVRLDETHTVKLGIARWSVAACIIDFAGRGAWGDPHMPLDGRLKHAWAAFQEWCGTVAVNCNARRFTKERLGIGRGKFAESASKAWNTRVLVAWLASKSGDLATRAVDNADHASMIALHMWSLHDFFLSMEEVKSQFFSESQADRCVSAGNHVVSSYGWLAREATNKKQLLWPIRPKVHALCHIIMYVQATRRNPKYTGCMIDEDFLGRVIRVAGKSSRRSASTNVLWRYIIRVACQWKGFLRKPRPRRRRKGLRDHFPKRRARP